MQTRLPIRSRRARRAVARVLSITAIATAMSLVTSAAHAAPDRPAAPADVPAAPAFAVNGEVAHYDYEWSDEKTAPNLIDGGPRAVHHNGAHAGPGTDNEVIWGIPGHTVRSLRLDGTNQYDSVPLTVPTDQSFTVSAWVQLDKKPDASYSVVTEGGSRVSGFYLKVNPDGKPLFGMPRGDSETVGWDTADGTVALTEKSGWTHLTGEYDAAAGVIRLYVNGVKVATTPHTVTWKATGELNIGRGMWAGQPGDHLPGRIADVRIWQRALSDVEASNVAIADSVVREDRCSLAVALHAGGPKVKALTAKALAGTVADVRNAANSGWGYGPIAAASVDDQRDQRAIQDAELAREGAWTDITKPFAVSGPDYMSFLNKPGYGAPIWAFLGDGKLVDPTGPPKPSQAALDRAIAIYQERRAAAGNNGGPSWYGFFVNEDVLKRLSAYQIARFIRLGGLPTVAPAKDSVEFRTEVEDLKAQWAGCDASDPLDPQHILNEVVATASAEWQAELGDQAKQRGDIVSADLTAYQDLRTATSAMVEAQGQAFIVSRMLVFQKYWQGKSSNDPNYPKPQTFANATAAMANARNAISAQLAIARQAAASAKAQADRATAAQTEAGKIAESGGTPYGRGLTHALQSAQVTKASAAAAQTASKAIETTLNAVAAGQADSAALYALADTQTHATQAEFQRAVAQEAADQAKAAAAAAAAQADQAAQAAARAKADREQAQQAERDAKAAADDAHAKRAVAEQERANAAAARQKADSERAKAAAAEAEATRKRAAAATALSAAESAGKTAADKESAAKTAEAQAYLARDAAAAAEARKDAATARQKALEAAADAAVGSADAKESRQAADQAKAAAAQATSAAGGARAAADEAGRSAIAARAAATEATGAAQRAQAASDAAQADVAVTSAAASTAHAAAADAIAASEQAAQNVKNAAEQVKVAAAAALKAELAQKAAQLQAAQAAADSARAAGRAHAASLSALAARDTAAAAITAGNQAIALGTPYRETDSAAALAVLVGQSGKTLAQQQNDAAQARADEAAKAAATAAALAAKAGSDAKAAAQASANAAADTTRALASLQQARASAAQAANEAAAAKVAETNTAKYDEQAHVDAFAAAAASTDAANEAGAARAAATAAEQDAATARNTATAAEADAARARATAEQADKAATEAEKAAANAQGAAQQADQSAQRAEEQQRKDEQAAQAARAAQVTAGPADTGPDLSGNDEQLLLAQCGQSCVDEFRKAKADAAKDVLDWVKENGGEILLDVLGVTDAKKCFTEGDVEGCLWTALNVASLVAVVGKLPAVSKAVIRIGEGIGKFFEESVAAKRAIDRLRKVIEDARKAAEGECTLELAAEGASGVVSAAFLRPEGAPAGSLRLAAGKKRFCGIKRAAVLHDDFCAKGSHINLLNGAEVALRPDEKGSIRGIVGRPAPRDATQAEIDAVIDIIKSDKSLREEIKSVARDAMRIFNTPGNQPGTWGGGWSCSTNRALELKFLIDALERMG
ncbi:LamG domain-containing protein [Kitasatospora sp. NPDC096204]|uniref:LamG domain-containing protein n=1 Tax=Kitasatospora sp. NPDC096204 TaxID=3364094 RepID=UPI003828C54B